MGHISRLLSLCMPLPSRLLHRMALSGLIKARERPRPKGEKREGKHREREELKKKEGEELKN